MIGLLLFIFILMSPYVLVILLASYARVGASVNPGKVKNWPMISVIMPTYNEESRVARKLEEVLDLDYPQDKLEIIVVDESTDDTPKIVRAFERGHSRIVRLLHHKERLGWARALHNGYTNARGSILAKMDCDSTLLTGSALKIAASYLASPQIGAVTGIYKPSEASEANYRSILHKLQIAESRMNSTLIAHGCFTAFRKNLYRPLNPNSLADESEIFVDIISQGYRAVLIPEIEAVEARPPDYLGTLAQRSRRAQGIVQLCLGKKGRLLLRAGFAETFLLLFNLYLIALSPFSLLAMAMAVFVLLNKMDASLGNMLFALSIVGVLAAWLHRRNVVSSFLDAQLAGAIGLFKALRQTSGVYERIR